MRTLTSFAIFLIYPIWFVVQVLGDKTNSQLKKSWASLFTIVVLIPLWIAGYTTVSLSSWILLQYVGIVRIDIPVSGASMLPTLEEKGYVAVHRYPHFSTNSIVSKTPVAAQLDKVFEPEIKKGDIVVFKNERTAEAFAEQDEDPRHKGGFVKRIIGTPGDTVSIRDGFVIVNGKAVEEPYILKAKSTFGGTTMNDCQLIKVPENKYLVMGDNRKVSLDSRHIGLIDFKEIQYYLPYHEQEQDFGKRWRDASKDSSMRFSSGLDVEEYVRLLNEKRAEFGIEPLTYEPKLEQSAEKRAKVMLEYNDLSFEATKSGYTMKKSLNDVGYSNVVYGEFPVIGYYEAQELIDSFFEYPASSEFLLQKDYDEIGISSFVGEMNGCPVQIVVQHLAGFVPPNYEPKDIQEWKTLIEKLKEIRGGWRDLKFKEDFYVNNKADVDRINEIILLRQQRADQIVRRMEANEWLNDQEREYVEEDKQLFDEQNAIADRLNKRIQGEN